MGEKGGKRGDSSPEAVFARLDERLAAIDLAASAAPAPPMAPAKPAAAEPARDSRLDALWDRLKDAEHSIASSAEDRRDAFHGLSTLIDARLSTLERPAPPPPAVLAALQQPPPAPPPPPAAPAAEPAADLRQIFERARARLAELPPLPTFERAPAPKPPAPEPETVTPAEPVREEPAPAAVELPRLELPPLEPEPAPAPVETKSPEPPAAAPAAQPSPAAAPRRRPRLWPAAALSGAALAALLVLWAGRTLRKPETAADFPLTSPRAVSLSLADGRLLSLDPERQLLYYVDARTGEISGIQKLAAPDLAAVAFGSDCLWAITNGGCVRQYATTPDHSLLRTYDVGLTRGGPLAWDGKALWIGAPQAARRYEVGETLSLSRVIDLPGVTPAGLQARDGALWVLDAAGRKALRYRLDGQPSPDATLDLSRILAADAAATGVAVSPSHAWVVTDNPGALHRLPLPAASR